MTHLTTLAALHAGIAVVALISSEWAIAGLELLLAAEYWRRQGDPPGPGAPDSTDETVHPVQ